jgi:plasmid stabilization system protein ParE
MTSPDGFRLLPLASQDISEIWQYIDESNPAAALAFVAGILETINTLIPFPHLGHRRTDLTSRPLRFMLFRNYLIAYAPNEKPLLVVAVIHGRQNPRVIAAMLRNREDFA